MTPKEKADELIDEFGSEFSCAVEFGDTKIISKRLALICVNTVINQLNGISKFATDDNLEKKKKYWKDVKEEVRNF